MKYVAPLVLAFVFPFSLYGEVPTDIATLQTQFVEVLSKSKQMSLDKIIHDFPIPEIDLSKKTEEAQLEEVLPIAKAVYDTVLKNMRSVSYCEPLGVLSLGTRINRMGFLVKFNTGACFWDITCYKNNDGKWVRVGLHFEAKEETNELLKIIPIEYWRKDLLLNVTYKGNPTIDFQSLKCAGVAITLEQDRQSPPK